MGAVHWLTLLGEEAFNTHHHERNRTSPDRPVR